ncbi:hypothetical protein TP41_03300 [Xanthomonas euvesicatoria pv. citrumelonis]|nr:hypothetical protein TP41_03300 [Xanthomonas euvesicatoria pv. citrumelonis]
MVEQFSWCVRFLSVRWYAGGQLRAVVIAIYHQTDKAGVEWQFNGPNWQRKAAIDLAQDGRRTSGELPVVASYEKSQELGALANAKAVELALGKAPPPQYPFNLPARASDQVGLDSQNWRRNPERQTWGCQVRHAKQRTEYYRCTVCPEVRLRR